MDMADYLTIIVLLFAVIGWYAGMRDGIIAAVNKAARKSGRR